MIRAIRPGTRWALGGAAGVALVAAGLSACSSTPDPARPSTSPLPSSAPQPTLSGLPECQFPEEVPTPNWVPKDLPLPDGTYVNEALPESVGYNRVIFVVPGSLEDLARFIIDEWPAAGWQLGRGESEPGEIETQFSRNPAVGAIRAQATYCTPGYSLMLLIYSEDVSAIPPIGTSGSPSPLASPSG